MVHTTHLIELKFWLLLFLSLFFPFVIYGILLAKRAISRRTVLIFGVLMIVIAGVDVYLLRKQTTVAETTPILQDNLPFIYELSVALYLFPALFAGIGINMISHVLTRHLDDAEKHFEEEHPHKKEPSE